MSWFTSIAMARPVRGADIAIGILALCPRLEIAGQHSTIIDDSASNGTGASRNHI